MAKRQGTNFGSTFFLQLALGAFFLVLGISDLSNYNSGLSELKRAFGKNDTLSIVMAVVELVMGAVLLLGLLITISDQLTRLLGIVLFVLWAVYIVIAFLAQNFLEPNFLTWLYRLSWHCVILVSIWIVGRKYI